MNLSTFQTWLSIIAVFLVWAGSLYAIIRNATKREAAVDAAIQKVSVDVDRVGERLNSTNLDCTKHEEAIQSLKIEQQQSRDDRTNMRERIAANFAAIQALQEELQQERIAVMSTLHANEKAAAERDAQTRVELAKITERLDIEQIVSAVVRHTRGMSS